MVSDERIDRWVIVTTGNPDRVHITDLQGCPVANQVYAPDAEWIVAQRERAVSQQAGEAADGE